MNKIIFYVLCLFLFWGIGCKKSEDLVMEEDIVSFSFAMSFSALDNPKQLIFDTQCEIIGDSIIECRIPYIIDNKILVPLFDFDGDSILVNSRKYDGGEIDFSKPVCIELHKGKMVHCYSVYVHTFTGLPIIWIETDDRTSIASKEEYVHASFKLVEDISYRNGIETDVYIKGRGNSSWTIAPKKSYRLKFDEKYSLLGEHKDKSWVLIANYFDKSMLRNKIAYYLGEISDLDYTPCFEFVELMLNGEYYGTYALSEKLKISQHRVNVGDDGFLLEEDLRVFDDSGSVYFRTNHLPNPIAIKEPDVVVGDDNYNYVMNFVQTAESVLFSEKFCDAEDGWQKYMDLESFVDWYLINEIARNGDAAFYTSVYMNLSRNGKLKMGPIWDFDVALGNNYLPTVYPTEGFYIKDNTQWFSRLFEDPIFVMKVKERFEYFYNQKTEILKQINFYAQYLSYSVEENDKKWGTLYTYTFPNHDIWGSYQNEVQLLKEWLDNRLEWLKKAYDNLEVPII